MVTAILWALLVANFAILNDFAQITFLFVWLLIAIIFSFGFQVFTGHRYIRLLAITMLWLGALSPIYMVASETIVTRANSVTEESRSISSETSTTTPGPEGTTPTIPELKGITDYLVSSVKPGSEVAFTANPLAIVTLLSDMKPYISSQHYAEGLGPMGSGEEYQRRLQLLRSWETNPKSNVTAQLCAEGVTIVITDGSLQDSNYSKFNPAAISDWQIIELPCDKS